MKIGHKSVDVSRLGRFDMIGRLVLVVFPSVYTFWNVQMLVEEINDEVAEKYDVDDGQLPAVKEHVQATIATTRTTIMTTPKT